ncbi:hypothetical protein MJG53_009786 [Ovis ammon polii x Ovis aries]|uniref:Uncharacterized protein n=1 Tax=Ovis ammon polii x Ovis aries TaxID=2918886 RepID=A0ACB9UUV6_9CETA|nr:hypothetical protein MJG53_009786 [Ovis ammon polii x Ovis aries]
MISGERWATGIASLSQTWKKRKKEQIQGTGTLAAPEKRTRCGKDRQQTQSQCSQRNGDKKSKPKEATSVLTEKTQDHQWQLSHLCKECINLPTGMTFRSSGTKLASMSSELAVFRTVALPGDSWIRGNKRISREEAVCVLSLLHMGEQMWENLNQIQAAVTTQGPGLNCKTVKAKEVRMDS